MATQHPAGKHLGFVSRGAEQTRAFGTLLGERLEPGDVILLQGPFGAGKTTLVQGLGAGLGAEGRVTSPSFTLINEYRGRLTLFHVDLFRLTALDPEMEQAIEDCESSDGVTVIEWPDMLPADLKRGALRIDMEVVGDDERSLLVHAEGSRWSPDDLAAMMQTVLHGQGAA